MTRLKHITVSEKNYEILRGLGHTSDSMNDVITAILNKVLQTGEPWREPQSTNTRESNGDDTNGRVYRTFLLKHLDIRKEEIGISPAERGDYTFWGVCCYYDMP